MDGTNEDQAYIGHHEREAKQLRSGPDGDAENMTDDEREAKAQLHEDRAEARRREL